MEGVNELEPLAGVILVSLFADSPAVVITQLDHDRHVALRALLTLCCCSSRLDIVSKFLKGFDPPLSGGDVCFVK